MLQRTHCYATPTKPDVIIRFAKKDQTENFVVNVLCQSIRRIDQILAEEKAEGEDADLVIFNRT